MGVLERAYPRIDRVVRAGFGVCWAGWQALGLGLLDLDEVMRNAVERFGGGAYSGSEYVREAGLWGWEREALARCFPGNGRILVGAAGAGREMVALSRAGYLVDGFECCRPLVETGQALLRDSGCAGQLVWAAAGEMGQFEGPFDGAIMGWSGYMYIPGRGRRIALLRQFRQVLRPGAPLLLSFETRSHCERRMRWAARGANWIRSLRGAAPVETGDRLDNGFKHWFSREDVAGEFLAAGFALEVYSTDGYGWAVGRVVGE